MSDLGRKFRIELFYIHVNFSFERCIHIRLLEINWSSYRQGHSLFMFYFWKFKTRKRIEFELQLFYIDKSDVVYLLKTLKEKLFPKKKEKFVRDFDKRPWDLRTDDKRP